MTAVVLLRRTGDNGNTGQPIAKVDSAFEGVFQVTRPLQPCLLIQPATYLSAIFAVEGFLYSRLTMCGRIAFAP
jgi:hypothetical protein